MLWKNLLLSGCLACFAANAASAGAWPRGKGNVFLSSSSSLSWPKGRAFEYPDVYGSSYAEYGLSDRLTLGADVGSADATRVSRLKAIGFLRYSLSDPAARHQFALDVGGGKHLGTPHVRIGASYGTGLELFNQSGWLALDAHVLFDPKSQKTTQALDMTLGVNLNKGKAMGLLSAHRAQSGATIYTFTPSYVRALGPRRHIEIGVTFDLSGSPNPALKLGVWQEF